MWKKLSKTKEPENAESAYDYAVFLLSLHLRTVKEVLGKMQKRGYSESVINKTIEQLKGQHYLDDQRYAEIFLENLKTYRNFGYYGVKKKMIEKKLPADLIESVLAEGLPLDEEIKIAERLLKKERFDGGAAIGRPPQDYDGLKYQTFGDAEHNKTKSKMANRLKSRGFRGEVVAKLLF
ncbi:MAG: RecX family transcriptional regulator [Patescibacteria group bacterium]|nr:RecX family transcriptional regulator [Patescibacteria group bacterium]